ncbi:MAG: fluoride efflux transporter CrcB [Solirubrobacteraceae bacterium]
MTTGTLLLVGVAGGAGSALRVLVDRLVLLRASATLPLGILVVNLTGALLLGLLTGLAAPHATALVLGAGLLGGYTTFSTWMVDTLRLAEGRRVAWAAANIGLAMVLGVAAIALGRTLGGG